MIFRTLAFLVIISSFCTSVFAGAGPNGEMDPKLYQLYLTEENCIKLDEFLFQQYATLGASSTRSKTAILAFQDIIISEELCKDLYKDMQTVLKGSRSLAITRLKKAIEPRFYRLVLLLDFIWDEMQDKIFDSMTEEEKTRTTKDIQILQYKKREKFKDYFYTYQAMLQCFLNIKGMESIQRHGPQAHLFLIDGHNTLLIADHTGPILFLPSQRHKVTVNYNGYFSDFMTRTLFWEDGAAKQSSGIVLATQRKKNEIYIVIYFGYHANPQKSFRSVNFVLGGEDTVEKWGKDKAYFIESGTEEALAFSDFLLDKLYGMDDSILAQDIKRAFMGSFLVPAETSEARVEEDEKYAEESVSVTAELASSGLIKVEIEPTLTEESASCGDESKTHVELSTGEVDVTLSPSTHSVLSDISLSPITVDSPRISSPRKVIEETSSCFQQQKKSPALFLQKLTNEFLGSIPEASDRSFDSIAYLACVKRWLSRISTEDKQYALQRTADRGSHFHYAVTLNNDKLATILVQRPHGRQKEKRHAACYRQDASDLVGKVLRVKNAEERSVSKKGKRR